MNDIRNASMSRLYTAPDNYKKSCPNCGAAIEGDTCKFCGTLFVDFACVEIGKPFYMKIKRQDGTIVIMPVRLTSIEKHADDNPYHCFGKEKLSMDFDIVPIN